MKNLIQYTYKASNLFFEYIHDRLSKAELIEGLYDIERYHRGLVGGKEKGIWFRFSSDDTYATTILNLDRDLDNYVSSKYTRELIIDAISLNGEFRIFYS